MRLLDYKKYLIIAVIALLMYLSYKIVSSFISSLIVAVILAIIFNPLYKKIRRIVKKKVIASGITIFLIFLILIIPLLFLTGPIIRETTTIQTTFNQLDFTSLSQKIQDITNTGVNLNTYAKSYSAKLSGFFINATSNIFLTVMGGILSIFIVGFTMFFIFMNSPAILRKVRELIPLTKEKKNKLFKDIQNTTNGIIFGLVISGMLQGIAGAIGFFILGIPNAIFWGIIMTILAILPAIGATAIWVPTSIYLLATDSMIRGVLLFLYGLFIISSIENILKPKLIGRKANIHPIVILLGLLGGLKVFGFAGLLIGPLILSLLVVFYRTIEDKNEA